MSGYSGYHNKYHRPGMRAARVQRDQRLKRFATLAEDVIVYVWVIIVAAALIGSCLYGGLS